MCCCLFVCVGWCLFGVALVVVRYFGCCSLFFVIVCCVMFEVCVACWRYVLFVLRCVSFVVCRAGFVVVRCFFCVSSVLVVVACYSLCVGRCAGVCCMLLDGCCLLAV